MTVEEDVAALTVRVVALETAGQALRQRVIRAEDAAEILKARVKVAEDKAFGEHRARVHLEELIADLQDRGAQVVQRVTDVEDGLTQVRDGGGVAVARLGALEDDVDSLKSTARARLVEHLADHAAAGADYRTWDETRGPRTARERKSTDDASGASPVTG